MDKTSGSNTDLKNEIYENQEQVTKVYPEGWSYPTGHQHQHTLIDRGYKSNPLIKFNGVEAFSKASSLYKGTGRTGEFWVDPKVDPNTGKVPKQPFVSYDYPTYRGPRDQRGLDPYTGRSTSNCHPIISPEANRVQDTTTCPEAIHTTWRDLRDQLSTGMGSRTNKFLLELVVPTYHDESLWKLNILCKATSFPQRQMHTASMFRFGRKYNLRGETNFGDTWTLTFEDDSELSLRKVFDYWFKDIDDSKLQYQGLYVYQDREDPQARLTTHVQDLYEREEGPRFKLSDFFNGATTSLLRPEYAPSAPKYQTDIRVYQLDQTGNKVMGYVMQNAFISEIGSVDYGDDKQNELVTYPVTFTYSEFLPLTGNVLDGKIRVFK